MAGECVIKVYLDDVCSRSRSGCVHGCKVTEVNSSVCVGRVGKMCEVREKVAVSDFENSDVCPDPS